MTCAILSQAGWFRKVSRCRKCVIYWGIPRSNRLSAMRILRLAFYTRRYLFLTR